MKFWQALSFTEPDQLVELARIAEDLGFEGVFCSDHLYFPKRLESPYPYSADGKPPFGPDTPFPDVWATLAAVASVTSTLKLSTSVFILPLRNPLEVAKSAATLSVLSANRFALGCGAGWMKEEFDLLGVDFHSRGRRYDEMIELLRLLWTGRMVEYHGEFFDFDALQMSPPPAGRIPVYIGGRSRLALRRAALVGDGWLGSGENPESAAEVLDLLAALRDEAGRGREAFEAVVPLTVAPEADQIRSLEDRGMTATVSYPLCYALGPTSSLEQKRQVLEHYAETVIVPLS
ncbi:MAG: LLM class F420-dependent oxidoreductase [Candidatus Binatia bacterium]